MIEQVGQTTMFIDADTLPLAEQVAAITSPVTRWVMMDEGDNALPPSRLPGYVGYVGDLGPWLETGDIARIYPDSSVEIVGRAKDVIKSGGEWISSPQVENAATSHPAIAEAAVISIPRLRWQERPLLLCTLTDPAAELDVAEVYRHMAQHIAKWWLPDETRVIPSMPRTTTGKIDKVSLRRQYTDRAENIIA